jgi:hypothetical protein
LNPAAARFSNANPAAAPGNPRFRQFQEMFGKRGGPLAARR